MTVLVVDDNHFQASCTALQLLSAGVEEADITVVSGPDAGSKAISTVQMKTFRLVITDRRMRGVDGWQLVEFLRRQSGASTNITMVTNKDSTDACWKDNLQKAADLKLPLVEKPLCISYVRELVSRLRAGAETDGSSRRVRFSDRPEQAFIVDSKDDYDRSQIDRISGWCPPSFRRWRWFDEDAEYIAAARAEALKQADEQPDQAALESVSVPILLPLVRNRRRHTIKDLRQARVEALERIALQNPQDVENS